MAEVTRVNKSHSRAAQQFLVREHAHEEHRSRPVTEAVLVLAVHVAITSNDYRKVVALVQLCALEGI